MIATVLACLGARRWLLELAGAAAIVAALLAYHHHVYTTGIAAQQAADAAATAKLQVAAAQKSQQLSDLATLAEHAHDTELAQLRAYRDRHPSQPVRLCLDPNARSGSVPDAAPAVGGDASAGAPAARLQQVPQRNPDVRPGTAGPDVGSLLGAWAARADGLSSELREWQQREPSESSPQPR